MLLYLPHSRHRMMQPQPQFITIKQLRHTLQPNDTPNLVTRFQLRNTRITVDPLNMRRGINKQRQRIPIQQEIEKTTNSLIGLPHLIKKALLMSVEGTNKVVVKSVHFAVKDRVVR